jgi:hypothetical protein
MKTSVRGINYYEYKSKKYVVYKYSQYIGSFNTFDEAKIAHDKWLKAYDANRRLYPESLHCVSKTMTPIQPSNTYIQ